MGTTSTGTPFVAQQPLVPLEGLAAGPVGVGVAGDPVGDLPQAQRARGVEQHQQQVGDPFEPVEAWHRGQSRARRAIGLDRAGRRRPLCLGSPPGGLGRRWSSWCAAWWSSAIAGSSGPAPHADPLAARGRVIRSPGPGPTAAVALTWPLADLAAHWSLTALVTQRVILVLVVAPLLLLGLPYDVIQWPTRPPSVDAVLLRLHRPPVAIVTVTAILFGSMTPALVRAQSTSALARGLLALAVLVAGLVLWMPVLGRIPGIPRLEAGGALRLPGGPGGGAGVPLLHLHLLQPPALRRVRPVPRSHRAAPPQRPADRRIRLQAEHAASSS